MMYTQLKSVLLILLAASGLLFFATPALAQEGPLLDDACNQAPGSPVCNQAANTNTNNNPVVRIIRSAANIIAIAGGVAAVIMIMIAGFTLITSAGNQENIAKSRRRIIYSLVGLIIIVLAWTITRFVTDRVL